VAEVCGQFGNPEEGERVSLEPVTRGLVKRQQTKKTQCVLCETAECVNLVSRHSEYNQELEVSNKSSYQSKPVPNSNA
jgi:hypothetical protein